MERSVFFLSDRTGITAETLGRSLLTQFDGILFKQTSWPFLDTLEKAHEAVERINRAAEEDGSRPILFSTLVNPEILAVIRESNGLLLDFFDAFGAPLEEELGVRSSHVMGRSHGISDYTTYTSRIDALNFALANDDGTTVNNYPAADIILVGVSRSGKTPTCLYLALQYGILAANYPLTEEDFEVTRLPEIIRPFKEKLFGLTIDAERLQQIRTERRPNSRYADMTQCRFELDAVQAIYRREGVRCINTSSMSIEEIATTIMQQAGLKRRLFG